jgi:hypothetical protein
MHGGIHLLRIDNKHFLGEPNLGQIYLKKPIWSMLSKAKESKLKQNSRNKKTRDFIEQTSNL